MKPPEIIIKVRQRDRIRDTLIVTAFFLGIVATILVLSLTIDFDSHMKSSRHGYFIRDKDSLRLSIEDMKKIDDSLFSTRFVLPDLWELILSDSVVNSGDFGILYQRLIDSSHKEQLEQITISR